MGGSSHTDTSTKVDPAQMALYQQNYATASDIANQPFQPYTGHSISQSARTLAGAANKVAALGSEYLSQFAKINTGAI